MTLFDHDYDKFPELRNSELTLLEFTSPHVQIKEDFQANVVKVHDGDTIRLRSDFRDFDFPLRLLEIDAPELSEGGQEAQEWLESRVLGQRVDIKINRNNRVGKFGRLLGKVFYQGLDVGTTMLSLGLVSVFGRKNEGEPEPLGKTLNIGKWL